MEGYKKYQKIKKLLLVVAIAVVALNSCENGNLEDNLLAVELEELNDSDLLSLNSSNEDANKVELANALLRISRDNQLVGDLHDHVIQSLEYGLDEIALVDEIMNPHKYTTQFKSASKLSAHLNELLQSSKVSPLRSTNGIFTIEGLEIYWPYSEDWDGVSQPVIVLNNDDKYIDGDKTFAYKFIKSGDTYIIDTLVVDENYAENNPVWVINNSHVSLQDIIDFKSGNPTSLNYISRQENESSTRSSELGSYVSTLEVKSIQSTKQHDDWLNGGSEYIIYWGFPMDTLFKLGEHHTAQIKFTRKEIKNKTTRFINFIGNYDWDKTQTHNKIKVIEYDPGRDIKFTFSLKGKYKAVEGEFKTEITINNNDDFIMEFLIPRKAYMKKENQISQYLFKNTFAQDGVTVVTNLYAEETIEPF